MITVVHLFEQLGQVKLIVIKRQVLAHLVDESSDVLVIPKVIVKDSALAKVVDVPGGVYNAVQETSVNCEVLGAAVVQVLECRQFNKKVFML